MPPAVENDLTILRLNVQNDIWTFSKLQVNDSFEIDFFQWERKEDIVQQSTDVNLAKIE